ncbi:MAG: hypothetical protein AAFR74_06630, partial [Pseudomonadota bacterium]
LLKDPRFARDPSHVPGSGRRLFWWMPPFMRPLLSTLIVRDGDDHRRLRGLVDQEADVDELLARGHDEATVRRIEHLLYIAEYKRRQAPPGVKVGGKNFGRDRRYPITNRFRDD